MIIQMLDLLPHSEKTATFLNKRWTWAMPIALEAF